jgi:ABC-type Zn uptake system ZnuABC Zn-binding protein ZnuA
VWPGAGVLAAFLSLLLLGCSGNTGGRGDAGEWPDRPGPRVVVSFAPLYCFAANVAGDDAVVKNVMTSKGPHDFDPTADDVRLVAKADLLLVVGLGLDEKKARVMLDGSGNKSGKLVELGAKLAKKDLCEGTCNHADHGHGHDHKHDIDPHVWLSPTHAAIFTNFIAAELKAADPAHADGYETRAAAYVAKLMALKEYGDKAFAGKADKRLVTFHDSLAYFEQAFDLNVRGVLTKKPGQEPDAKEFKELIEICKHPRQPVRVIATEPQYANSPSGEALRKALADAGVNDPVLVEFDPLETVRQDELAPDWYERRMRANIDRLAEKMK